MAEQTARHKGEFGQAFDCRTPESQKYLVGMILAGTGASKAQSSNNQSASTAMEAWQAHLKEMVELARRHGVKVDALPGNVTVLDPDGCKALADQFPVDNPREYFAEYWRMFTDVQKTMTGKTIGSEEFTITDLKIEGDQAYATKQRENYELKLPIAFQRIDGNWFLDEVAILKRSPDTMEDESE